MSKISAWKIHDGYVDIKIFLYQKYISITEKKYNPNLTVHKMIQFFCSNVYDSLIHML